MGRRGVKMLFVTDYMALFSDGHIGLSDGVGYLDDMSPEEVKELYLALKQYLEEGKCL